MRRFLRTPPPVANPPPDELLTAFLDGLAREGREDWQVEQARRAVTTWLGWRSHTQNARLPPKAERHLDGSIPPEDTTAARRDSIRVRHYSYRSEQTYLDWVRRFFDYLRTVGATVEGRPIVTTETVQDFISHLATQLHVAASQKLRIRNRERTAELLVPA